jgi:hypothetical protein
MSAASARVPRRVLLGLAELGHMQETIEAAATFASVLRTELLCVMVEHEDFWSAAGLPFATAFGPGGFAAPLSAEAIESHFRSLARMAERALARCCGPGNVTWHLARPHGEYFHELALALAEGDVVVVNPRHVGLARRGLLAAARDMLDKAAAVVVPAAAARRPKWVVAVTGDAPAAEAGPLARLIASALGAGFATVAAADLPAALPGDAAIVAPIALAEALGEKQFLRAAAAAGAIVILVPGGD